MSFSNLIFPFLFLPLALALYHFIPGKGKQIVLLVLSLVFFAWGNPVYLVLLLLILGFNYLSGLEMQKYPAKAKGVLITAVVVNLLLLGFFKYAGFLVRSLNGLLGTSLSEPKLAAPIGVSFFTFSILSYLFDVCRGKAPMPGLLDFSVYVTFFPKLVSGPIVPFHEFAEQCKPHPLDGAKLGSGARKFLVGLAKKLLVADALGTTFYAVSALPLGQVSTLTAWLGALSYTLMLYFDFSGYSDMALGLAEMLGFTFRKNFDYPYCADSLTDFWRRWHVSLGAWFRDYVYIPLGGSRAGKGKTIRNLLIVWLLTGIWHGADWTFLCWGLYHGGLLLLEKFVLNKFAEKLPRPLKRVLTLLLVVIGWVFFFAPDLGTAFGWLGRMLGLGGSFLDGAAKYYLAASWKLLLLGAVGCGPLIASVGGNLVRSRSLPVRIGCAAVFAVLLWLCVACMVSSTYTSFLYFQF